MVQQACFLPLPSALAVALRDLAEDLETKPAIGRSTAIEEEQGAPWVPWAPSSAHEMAVVAGSDRLLMNQMEGGDLEEVDRPIAVVALACRPADPWPW